MQQIMDFYSDALSTLKTETEGLLSRLTHAQILLAFGVMLALIVLLLVLLLLKGRQRNVGTDAQRLMREAQDYALEISGLADCGRAEILANAHKEADAIRETAQQMLARAHDTLKHAQGRARDIVDEARAAIDQPQVAQKLLTQLPETEADRAQDLPRT